MKNIRLMALGAAVAAGVAAMALVARAQYDASEAPQRIQDQQWDKAMDQTRGKEPVPLTPQGGISKGERKFMELANIPTGYLYREFTIKQSMLRGNWSKAVVVPAAGFESEWAYVAPENYKAALAQGVDVARLKGTPYAPFTADMKKACTDGVPAKKPVRVQAPTGREQWLTASIDPSAGWQAG